MEVLCHDESGEMDTYMLEVPEYAMNNGMEAMVQVVSWGR